MRVRLARILLVGSLAFSTIGVACDESDRPEGEDIQRGVEEGGEEVEEQIDEGGEEGGEGGGGN
jgi:hypothetical protein